jgi:uncharacterized protein YwqG
MYDRVLLQIDSTRDGNSSIIWGDLGIANILVTFSVLDCSFLDLFGQNMDNHQVD